MEDLDVSGDIGGDSLDGFDFLELLFLVAFGAGLGCVLAMLSGEVSGEILCTDYVWLFWPSKL